MVGADGTSWRRRCFAAGEVDIGGLDETSRVRSGEPHGEGGVDQRLPRRRVACPRVSLASWLGVERTRVECGVSVGITATTEQLVDQVAGYLDDGYRRIKLKIEPGLDVDRVRAVREANPDIALSVDANAAYGLADLDVFRALDEFGLLMIEQPLHHDDLVRHADLQAQIETAICLDESIRSVARAEDALRLGSCRIINIKQGRVGGVPQARGVHDVGARRRRAGVVWGHARDGRGTCPQPGARGDAGVHPAR